ncbi:MAG: GatB/YqeY domain-containing protein [Egibacteraceae bacterium]
MAISEQIQSDLVSAMKARDADAVATLRLIIAAIQNARVAEGHSGEVTDQETLELLNREAKRRNEAATTYDAAGRDELAAKERRELEIIRRYLPRQLSADELRAIVDDTVARVGASGPSDLGRVMGALMPQVKGLADGRQVNALVRLRLGA